ncbi:unnamed protein product [Angiostrongylus costaricensis]|uniref:Endo/exonuclease/phosphatase domain-containing protein n=1 Tax=Angiostrongylus costaricensis TaxID=334426 RepID=A0A0R3PAT9_ANGCS|nr:unnamed protein product [Angiostrongylus costaricensis]
MNAESSKVTKRRLFPETPLIRWREVARAAGNRNLTSELARQLRQAVKEDLKERRAAVINELQRFVVHLFIVHVVDSYQILSLRIAVLGLQLSHHKKITIINCYSPIDAADEYELNAFCYQLEEVFRNDKAYHKFVVGNFNAKTGKTNESEYRIGNLGLGQRNENGNRLAGLAAARLFHGTRFSRRKKERRCWTWESPNGMTYAEIDHILKNRRWCLLDTSVGSSFCTGSDHRLLRAKIRFSCKLEKNFLHRPRGKNRAVYDENILNEFLPNVTGRLKKIRPKTTSCLSKD